MSQPYVGEIRMFGGNFAPSGWMFCEGQLLPISEYETLFNLIGTTYGGDGQNTFALPDLRGRIPIHMGQSTGSSWTLAETAGVETVTLTTGQIPLHTHLPQAKNSAGGVGNPTGNYWGGASSNVYSTAAPSVAMASGLPASTGGSQPHENLPPYLCLSFIISLFGVFPSQT